MLEEDGISKILQGRCGTLTVAYLKDGSRLEIYNAAWGRDLGAICDHVTTNVSPFPSDTCPIDFFHTSEVLRLEDDQGEVLYEDSGHEA